MAMTIVSGGWKGIPYRQENVSGSGLREDRQPSSEQSLRVLVVRREHEGESQD